MIPSNVPENKGCFALWFFRVLVIRIKIAFELGLIFLANKPDCFWFYDKASG